MKINRVTISVPEEVDLIFRRNAAIKFAFKRGWYGRAILEAMQLWITNQNSKKKGISDGSKSYLWNAFKEKIDIDSDDPEQILDSIVEYFENDLKYAEKIDYRLNDDKIIIEKKQSLESYLPQLITQKDDSVYLGCLVETIASAALEDLTGQTYTTSNSYTLLHTYEVTESDTNPRQKDKIEQKDKIVEGQLNSIKSE